MKTILQVRFLKVGFMCLTHIELDDDGILLHKVFELYKSLVCSPAKSTTHFWREYSFAEMQQKFNALVKTLNSSERKVPRIERTSNCEYALHRSNADATILNEDSLGALNQIIERQGGKLLEIYEPKTIKADWKRLYPREFEIDDFDVSNCLHSISEVLSKAAQLQQTEAGGLEVHELIVYEV